MLEKSYRGNEVGKVCKMKSSIKKLRKSFHRSIKGWEERLGELEVNWMDKNTGNGRNPKTSLVI
jgi:hypothetical protein